MKVPLPMNDRDIAAHFKRNGDLTVLADLNATDKDTIRAALAREGITTPARRGRKKKQTDAAADMLVAGTPEPEKSRAVTASGPAVKGQGTSDDEREALREIPQSEIKDVFMSILAVLEAVPEWATKYTRDRAAELADAIMRDFLCAWKLSRDQEPEHEERSEGP